MRQIYIGDRLLEKVFITEILVTRGHFNTINYVFEIKNRKAGYLS